MGKLDLLLKNCSIIDGTGNPGYHADIGITRGKIALIRKNINRSEAGQVIDAERKTVCPGFIDTHSHDDAYLFINPQCDEKVCQGVTTDIIGNCGFSLAPVSSGHLEDLKKAASILGANHLGDEFWNLSSFNDFLTRLENKKPGINVASLVGHNTIRIAVLGYETRSPSQSELAEMKRMTWDAMQAGAFGLSSGLIYFPATYAQTEELIELAGIAAQFNGIYATHMRSEADHQIAAINETLRIAEEAGIAAHISHHKIAGKQNWGQSKETLELFAKARANGLDITCDQYPYRAGSTYLAAVLPQSIQAQDPQAFSNLKDSSVRQTIINEIENNSGNHWENLINIIGFDNIIISVSPRHKPYIGQSIAQIAETEGKNPFDVIFDLLIEEQMDVTMIAFGMDEKDIENIMKNPVTMFGTDGCPGFDKSKTHPRMTGTFPRILGHYVREQGILSLEQAIRKMTSFPAQTFGLYQKGILRQNMDADIVVFDPDTIIDMSTFKEPMQPPRGISHVIVNGEVAVENGKVLGITSGQVLRRR